VGVRHDVGDQRGGVADTNDVGCDVGRQVNDADGKECHGLLVPCSWKVIKSYEALADRECKIWSIITTGCFFSYLTGNRRPDALVSFF